MGNNIDRQKKNKILLLLFFIHPFVSFLLSLITLKNRNTFRVIMLFFVLFGYTFIAHNESADSYRYIEDFNRYKYTTTKNYLTDISDYFTFDSSIKDIYDITTYYLVSRITNNYHVLMALWAFVFSFFFLKAFRFLVFRPEWNNTLLVAIITFLFFFSNPITNINGVRFWTASWIAVFTIFEIVINKNHRYFLLAFITPLVHISFTSFVIVLLLYLFIIKYEKLLVVVYIISFFVGSISLELFKDYSANLPPIFQNLIWSYTESWMAIERMKGIDQPLYAEIFNKLPMYFMNFLLFVFIIKSNIVRQKTEAYSVYLFLMVWMSFVNFTIAIPSFGGRFIALSVPLIMYLSLLMLKQISVLRYAFFIAPFIYSYAIFQWFRFIGTIIDYYLLLSIFPHLIIKNAI